MLKSAIACLLVFCAALIAAAGAGAQTAVLSPAQIAWYRTRLAEQEAGQFTPAELPAEDAQAIPRHPIADRLLTWDRLRRPAYGATVPELAAFLAASPDWPQRTTLQLRVEQMLATSATDSLARLAYFSRNPPVSALGRVRYAEALLAQGRMPEARLQAREAWRQGLAAALEEAFILETFGADLLPGDHKGRLEKLLWSGQTTAAQRMLGLLPEDERLAAQARIALRTRARDALAVLAAVPASHRHAAGVAWEASRYLRAAPGGDGAAIDELLSAVSRTSDIGDAGAWAKDRLRLARPLLESDPARAYRLIAGHGLDPADDNFPDEDLEDRSAYVDLEWLAGWTALRKLGRPADALRHFAAITAVGQMPQTLSRAAYWAGRAAEAQGKALVARQWYNRAAQHGDTFYGQLATDLLGYGAAPLPLTRPAVDEAGRQAFERRPIVQAALLLGTLDQRTLQSQFLRHIAREARNAAEKRQVADLAYAVDRLDIAVFVGKQADAKGIDLAYAAFPQLSVAGMAEEDWVMVHAITRQESLFNRSAISRAGARGLMQLMPGTAQQVAQSSGLDYDPQRLLSDPQYNLRLGSAYYRAMLSRWGGSHVLAVASYNAGPGNVSRWLDQFGDPRNPAVDAVEWIERIPFSETRNYVQRVLENAVVYDAIRKTAGNAAPASQWHRLTPFLRPAPASAS